MKRLIRAAELNTYTVHVNFAGFIGADEDYTVNAADEDEAIAIAEEEAGEDLRVVDLEQIDDDEWEGTVSFNGMYGAEETYTTAASDEESAEEEILSIAKMDLSGTIDGYDELA